MKRDYNPDRFGLIVLSIYLISIFTYVALTKDLPIPGEIGSIIGPTYIHPESPVNIFETPTQIDQPFEPFQIIVCTKSEPIDDQILVAEPLHGKELYIFYISQIVEQYYPDVDPYIALAVLEIESDYNPKCKSSAGAVGLMQVIPKYHAWRIEKYGLNDIWDPYSNIICGMDFLNELYTNRGSWSKALFGYNASKTYVNVVLNRADKLRKDGYFG